MRQGNLAVSGVLIWRAGAPLPLFRVAFANHGAKRLSFLGAPGMLEFRPHLLLAGSSFVRRVEYTQPKLRRAPL